MIRSTIGDIDISDLATCLKISLDGRDETGDQIVQSFLLWQSKNVEDFSREKLFQCLQQLQGATALMEKLWESYSQYIIIILMPNMCINIYYISRYRTSSDW